METYTEIPQCTACPWGTTSLFGSDAEEDCTPLPSQAQYAYLQEANCDTQGYEYVTSLDGCIDAAEKMYGDTGLAGYPCYGHVDCTSVTFLESSQYAMGCIVVKSLDKTYGHGVYFFPTGEKSCGKITDDPKADGVDRWFHCLCKVSCALGQTGEFCWNCLEGTYKDSTGPGACIA